MNLSEKIRYLRIQKGMTQAELAEKLNTTKQTIGKYENQVVTNLPLNRIQELADALEEKKITSKQGKEVFAEMLSSNKLPSVIIKEKGMEVVSDEGAIEKIVNEVIAANPKAIEDFKSGKTNVVGWLMGQVMKASQGKANPGQATKMINEKLAKL